MTDGEDNQNTYSYDSLIEKANKNNISIYTIGLGSGTAEDPYVITGSEDLWKFAEIVKASSDRNECAKVADGVTEIDTTVRGEKKDLTWNPIGFL